MRVDFHSMMECVRHTLDSHKQVTNPTDRQLLMEGVTDRVCDVQDDLEQRMLKQRQEWRRAELKGQDRAERDHYAMVRPKPIDRLAAQINGSN